MRAWNDGPVSKDTGTDSGSFRPDEDTRRLLPRFRSNHAVNVSYWLRGVFEGGGAKGVAYSGALEAVEEKGCWFQAVAGASAGAITAALIAAGYSARELRVPMDRLLALLELPSPWTGLRRLRRRGEVFSRRDFREELDFLLRAKVDFLDELSKESGESRPRDRVDAESKESDPKDGRSVTFERLYETTGAHLYVVAADVSRREPFVFHHRYTPKCRVADAVASSSSIPFFFDGGMLISSIPRPRPKEDRKVFRTIVDGGVMTNFPMFVFEERTFECFMWKVGKSNEVSTELSPGEQHRPAGPVVGFLLHELVTDIAEGDRAKLRTDTADEAAMKRIVAKIVKEDEKKRDSANQAAYKDAEFLSDEKESDEKEVVPFEQTEGVGTSPGRDGRRWPIPSSESSSRCIRYGLPIVDKALGFASLLPVSVLALLVVAVSESALVAGSWWALGRVGILEKLAADGLPGFFAWVVTGLAAALYLAQLLSVAALFGTSVLGNWVLWLPARRVLYSLGRSLVAAPGGPPWQYLGTDVIALPIPRTLGTLGVRGGEGGGKIDRVEKEVVYEEAIQLARVTTRQRLPEILAQR